MKMRLIVLSLAVTGILAYSTGCGGGGSTSSNPDSLAVKGDTGSLEYKIGRLTQEIRFSPANYDLYYRRSKLFYESGNTVQALSDAEKVIEYNVTWPQGYHLRGFYRYVQNQDSAALEDFRRSASLGSEDPETFETMGHIFLLMKKYKEAENAYDQALRQDSTQAAYYFSKGYLYEQQKRYDDALKWYDNALKWDRTYIKAWAQAHDIFLNVRKDEGKAYEMNARILEVDSLHPIGRFNQGNVFMRQAEDITDPAKMPDYTILMKLAISEYGRSIQRDPQFKLAWYNRGFCYLQIERYDDALRDFNKVIELDPFYEQAFFMKGSILEFQGKSDEALENYKQALELNPDFRDARQAVSELEAGRKAGN